VTSADLPVEHPQPTERFHRVLAFATDEADGLGHGFITCQHILYALSLENKGIASAALGSLGITPDILREILSDSSAEHDRIDSQVDLSDEVGAMLQRAVAAAQDWGHRWLDTEHLLHGIAGAPTSADEIFAALHVVPSDIVSRLTELRESAPPAAIREEASHAYRFTLESAWLLSLATDTARQYGAASVGSLHLLAALLSLEGTTQQILTGTLAVQCEDVTKRLRSSESSMRGGTRLPLADDVQRILGYAIGEAWNRGHQAVAPVHVAMGLARADERNLALDVLAELGVSQADLVDALRAAMPPATTR
jgi:ATP-dependent Clp protease ATP-binding subunit ClpA